MRNQALEAALTFLAKAAEVMRLVGVKNGFIITCATHVTWPSTQKMKMQGRYGPGVRRVWD